MLVSHLGKALCALALLSCGPASLYAQSTSYPEKPIRMVVPWAAGNLTDIVARTVSEKLSKNLGQQVWVDNKPGAAGSVGMGALGSAPADGYTIGLSAIGPMAISPALYSKLPFDPVNGSSPISLVFMGPAFVILTNTTVPVSNLKELVEYSKAQPNGLNYASAGNGTLQHMTAEIFARYSGAKLVHVPHRGSSQAAASVLGRHIPILFETISVGLPHVQSGALKALAISSTKRSSLAKDVPTFAEAGFPDVVTEGWQCLLAPPGTPVEIRLRLSAALKKIMSTPEMESWANGLGGSAVASSPDELAAYVKQEMSRWNALVRTAGIKVE